jgi:hypothetical protein
MSVSTTVETESFSVAFEPSSGTLENLAPPPELSKYPIVKQILENLGQPLLELGRRARRVGPIDAGTIVLLAGCQDGVGCSTAALACAAMASTEGPTALIDGAMPNLKSEFRNPESPNSERHTLPSQGRTLTQLLVGRATVGWNDVVSGVAAIQEAVHHIDPREALAFFPQSETRDFGMPISDFGFSQAGWAGWFGRLRQDFGLVFLDGGSVESGAIQWAPWVDTVLIVRDPRRDSARDWTKSWDRFEESGTHVLGIVETFV